MEVPWQELRVEEDLVVGTVPLEPLEAPSEPAGDLLPGLTLDRRFRRSRKNGMTLSTSAARRVGLHEHA